MNSSVKEIILDEGFSGDIYENSDISELTTIKIGGRVRFLLYPADEKDLVLLAKIIKKINAKYFVLGSGSNTIFKDGIYNGIVICLAKMNTFSVFLDGLIRVEAGCPLYKVISEAHKTGFVGMEELIGIPGSVGGAVMSNAGAFGKSIGEFIKDLEVITREGEIAVLQRGDFSFSYRTVHIKDIMPFAISKVELGLIKGNVKEAQKRANLFLRKRRAQQPLDQPSAGSVFKNPSGMYAAELIDACGLKGERIGGLEISKKHANFIVNLGNGTRKDFDALVSIVRKEVFKKFSVKLEMEVVCVG